MTIITGRLALLVFILVFGAIVLIGINRSVAGTWVPKIRHLAGLDAIEEAVGRATEMGTPVHFSPGIGGITDDSAPQTFAGLEVMAYVTELTAKYNTELIASIRNAAVFPLAQELVRQGYMTAGRPDMFQEETVRFLSSEQFAYAAAVCGILERRNVAASILIGAFWAESLLFAETGASVGAIQVAGTASLHQLPFFVATCDYVLLGEEIYAAGAYLSQDKVKLGSIGAQDIAKGIAMVILVVGSLLASAEITVIRDFLAK